MYRNKHRHPPLECTTYLCKYYEKWALYTIVPLIMKKGIITRHNNKYKNFLADVSEHNKKQ